MAKTLETKGLDFEIKICPKCGKPLNKKLTILNKDMVVPIMCDCKKREVEEKEKLQSNREKQIRAQRILKTSLMTDEFRKKTFNHWDFKLGVRKLYTIGSKYALKFKEMKEQNIGLLIYGEPGNGKTYTAVAIANELLDQMVPVICVSINSLLDRIKETYSRFGNEGEDTILRSLANVDLLIVDDLGTEQDTDWAKTKIYNILDSRYRNGLPLIITTNLPLNDLQGRYEKRTYDRVLEMCTPVENTGPSIRIEKAKKKTQILKQLLN